MLTYRYCRRVLPVRRGAPGADALAADGGDQVLHPGHGVADTVPQPTPHLVLGDRDRAPRAVGRGGVVGVLAGAGARGHGMSCIFFFFFCIWVLHLCILVRAFLGVY
jgi:hypothetical protein